MNNKGSYQSIDIEANCGGYDAYGKNARNQSSAACKYGILVALCIFCLAFILFQQYEILQLSSKISSIQNIVNSSRTFSQLVQESAQLSETIFKVRLNLTRDSEIMTSFNITALPQAQIQSLEYGINRAQLSADISYTYTSSFVDVIALAFTVFSIIIALHHYSTYFLAVEEMKKPTTEQKSEPQLASAFCASKSLKRLWWILFLPPVCAIVNWIMLAFNGSWINDYVISGLQGAIDCWTAVAIYSFFKLMTRTMRFNAAYDEDFETEYLKNKLKENKNWRLYAADNDEIFTDLNKCNLQAALLEKIKTIEIKNPPSLYERIYDQLYKSIAGCCDWTVCFKRIFNRKEFEGMITLYPNPDSINFNEPNIIPSSIEFDEELREKVADAELKEIFLWFYDARVYTLQFCILRIFFACINWLIILILNEFGLMTWVYETIVDWLDLILYVLAYRVVELFMKDWASKILEVQEPNWKCFCLQWLAVYAFVQQYALNILFAVLQLIGFTVVEMTPTISENTWNILFTAYNDVTPYSNKWQYFFVCIEMFVITVIMYIKYDPRDWEVANFEKKRKELNIQHKKLATEALLGLPVPKFGLAVNMSR